MSTTPDVFVRCDECGFALQIWPPLDRPNERPTIAHQPAGMHYMVWPDAVTALITEINDMLGETEEPQ